MNTRKSTLWNGHFAISESLVALFVSEISPTDPKSLLWRGALAGIKIYKNNFRCMYQSILSLSLLFFSKKDEWDVFLGFSNDFPFRHTNMFPSLVTFTLSIRLLSFSTMFAWSHWLMGRCNSKSSREVVNLFRKMKNWLTQNNTFLLTMTDRQTDRQTDTFTSEL